jgi:hypothetical protein
MPLRLPGALAAPNSKGALKQNAKAKEEVKWIKKVKKVRTSL